MTKCSQTNLDGSPCAANAGEDGLCAFHSKRSEAAIVAARSRGGRTRRCITVGDYPQQLTSFEDVSALYAAILTDMREHENSIARARILISLGQAAVELGRGREIAQRLDRLEAIVSLRGGGSAKPTE